MVRLSSEEKEELLRGSSSEQIRDDFRRMRENRQHLKKASAVDLDRYIAFVTDANAFANHSMKAFRKMRGDTFKL